MHRILLLTLWLIGSLSMSLQAQPFTRADTLRGSVTSERAWWDVVFYDLFVHPNPADSSLVGQNDIHYRVIKPGFVLQLDLQEPMEIERVMQNGQELSYVREGNVFFITMPAMAETGSIQVLSVQYRGKPTVAKRAPWDGGLVWARDAQQRPWIATACQGIGASVWWPLKDHQSDEPDSMRIKIKAGEGLIGVSNGRLRSRKAQLDGTEVFEWFVSNPINSYGVTMNVASYAQFNDQMTGEEGPLDLSYWVLDYNLNRAKRHFAVVDTMIRAFEHWFGPYPYYRDSFKLIETPFVGMEHQSGVAYGNRYLLGYTGRDLSNSGWGLKWDFMIVHESGHEWFGNNITTHDIADMWVHEGFTHYSETLFTEYVYGKDAANAYVQGIRRNILNDKPIIGIYDVHKKGSGDMYYKGAAMLHTIRQIIGNDSTFRQILRGMNQTYRHGTVRTQDIEHYISTVSGINFAPVFDQYLRTTQIPTLEYYKEGSTLYYRWGKVVEGFSMPVELQLGLTMTVLTPSTDWKQLRISEADYAKGIQVNPNYYVLTAKVQKTK